MVDFIAGGQGSLEAAREAIHFIQTTNQTAGPKGESLLFRMADIQVNAPVSRPPKFFAITVNYRENWEKATKPPDPHPTYFPKLNTCIVGPFDPVEIPDIGVVGPEVEIAAVIGKRGKKISSEEAEEYIFGYTIHNDITGHEMRKKSEWIIMKRKDGTEEKLTYPGRYKCFDTFSPMGPWLVTRDEIKNVHALQMTCRLNGEVVQTGNSGELVFKFPFLVSYLSEAHTLEPGDLISGGTCPPAPGWTMLTIDLRRIGGILESEIEGLGLMKNPIKPV
jgi:2-keto-4-pentenoate hydratase/2-oxohepta-3-ene-1,7-dioic acid hydratase in catechol pathway